MIYIASPYSDTSAKIREIRFQQACEHAANLFLGGYSAFSPIAHSHPISNYLPESTNNWEFWRDYDLEMLDLCDELHVLCIDGWDKSRGVKEEIEYANKKLIKIVYVFV